MVRNKILQLVQKYLLPKHQFVAPDLIRRKNNNRIVFEVQMVAYTKDLQPMIFATALNGGALVSISGKDHHDWEEHKAKAPGSMTFDLGVATKLSAQDDAKEKARIDKAKAEIARHNEDK